MTKVKRLLTSALLLALLSAAATVPAGIILVPINDLMLDESGVTDARRLPDGRIRVDTQGLSMVHFDGSDVGFRSLQLILDDTAGSERRTYAVTGRANGLIRFSTPMADVLGFSQAEFRGEVTGSAGCPPSEQPPCATLNLTLRIRAVLRQDDADNDLAGITELRLKGTLTRTGREFEWILLGGNVDVASFVDISDPENP